MKVIEMSKCIIFCLFGLLCLVFIVSCDKPSEEKLPSVNDVEKQIASEWDEMYKSVKSDPKKLKSMRSKRLDYAKRYCAKRKGKAIEDDIIKLMDMAILSIEERTIDNGTPLLLDACISNERFVVEWLHSDYDVEEIVFVKDGPKVVIRPFKNVNQEKFFIFNYLQKLEGSFEIIKDFGEEDRIIETRFESFNECHFLLPDSACIVWIKDSKGNISNKLTLRNTN
ncbi:MAG: hypothetical protein JEZ07_19760 [Phycisphaerae bacterium]|nr:hypothetical protein [Phycisphaerae bacterium]